MIPPAQAFLEEADGGPGHGEMRIFDGPRVRPAPCSAISDWRAGGRPRWYSRRSSRPRHRPGIGSPPNPRRPSHACRARRGADGASIQEPETVLVQALQPHLAPALPHDGRIRRGRVDREDGRAPAQLVDQQAATHGEYVVGIAVAVEAMETTAFRAGGRRAAIWSPLKPPRRCRSSRPCRCTRAGRRSRR